MEHALQSSKTSDTALHAQLCLVKDTRELKRAAQRLAKLSCADMDRWNEKSVGIAEQLLR